MPAANHAGRDRLSLPKPKSGTSGEVSDMPSTDGSRMVVVGGGVADLEALLTAVASSYSPST
jgi:hypothetical protein